MKHVKQIAALLLAMIMVLGLCAGAFAAGETTGSITIHGVLPGNRYAVYKIFDLSFAPGEAGSSTAASYSYTISQKIDEKVNPLYEIIRTMTINEGTEEEPQNVTVFTLTDNPGDSNVKYVTLSTEIGQVPDTDDTTPRKIATKLLELIKEYNSNSANSDNPISFTQQIDKVGIGNDKGEKLPNGSVINVTEYTEAETQIQKYDIKFTGLPLGYYLVDTSAGTMLGLTTTDPDAKIDAKNDLPGIQKRY